MAVRKIKVYGVSDIFVNEAPGGGASAGIYPNMAAFPDPSANPGLFAIDSSTPRRRTRDLVLCVRRFVVRDFYFGSGSLRRWS